MQGQRKHFRGVHKSNPYVRCCKYIFHKPNKLVDHINWHRNPDSLNCRYSLQCTPQRSGFIQSVNNFSSDLFQENMVVIAVHGVYLDQAASMGFLKCAVAYQIVNEQLNVFNPTQNQIKNAFKYFKNDSQLKKEELTVDDKEALLIMLQEVTNLKSIWCTRRLEDGKWDFEKALQGFLELCQRKEVPDTAFI